MIHYPGLSPSNIFISDTSDIAGIIDWQHAIFLLIFLQAKIPKHFQNYSDDNSQNIHRPRLWEEFATISNSNSNKEIEMELYRRRQVHDSYLGYTSKLNKAHFYAIGKCNLVLGSQLYNVASRSQEGNNTSLQAQLIKTIAQWSEINSPESLLLFATPEPKLRNVLIGMQSRRKSRSRYSICATLLGSILMAQY